MKDTFGVSAIQGEHYVIRRVKKRLTKRLLRFSEVQHCQKAKVSLNLARVTSEQAQGMAGIVVSMTGNLLGEESE